MNVIFGTIRINLKLKENTLQKVNCSKGILSGLSKWQTSSDEMFKTYVKLSKRRG